LLTLTGRQQTQQSSFTDVLLDGFFSGGITVVHLLVSFLATCLVIAFGPVNGSTIISLAIWIHSALLLSLYLLLLGFLYVVIRTWYRVWSAK